MLIERLRSEDWERLRCLRLAALADAPDAFASTLAETRERDESDWRSQLDRLATFVAVRDGDDVGMVRGAADGERPEDAWLLSMWVAPRARGCGVGAAMLGAVAAWARAAGYARLLLDVADDNRAAIALYDRCGFVPTGITGSLPAPRQHIREHQRALHLTSR